VSTTEATDPRAAALFEPIRIGGLELPNRLVMAPMGTCLDADGEITDATVAYYARRARGGVGAVTVEGCLVSADTQGPEPRISSPAYLPGLTRLASTLEGLGAVPGVQLMHPGRQVVAGPSVAPSPVPLNSMAPTPQELTVAEIEAIVADYARAAELAHEAGFRFLEVHGAHGYLPSNFLSPLDNRRTDDYGGDLAGRARFSLEVARAIVAAVGPEVPLVWRLNGQDAIPDGFDLDEAVAVAGMLEEAGVAALSVTAGTWHTLHVTLAPMFVPRGQMVPLAAAIKAAVEVPVMAVGRLDDPELAAGVVASGQADLICLGRGLIAEPDWPAKVGRGEAEELRPCISCNACVDRVGRGERAKCSVNPEVGRELEWRVAPASRQRRVMVVGSGPAGMEAARIAALRGHEVSIWERDPQLGGKLEVAGLAPSKREVLRYRDYQVKQLRELGVEAHTGVDVSVELIGARRPDAVVVATGAEPLIPPIPGIGGANVHSALDLLLGAVPVRAGERIAVIGGSATGCETAEHAAEAGAEVTIFELLPSVGTGIEAITRRQLIRALRGAGVGLMTRCKVVMIEPEQLLYEDAEGATASAPVDKVALAIGWRPSGHDLGDAVASLGIETVVLGDAAAPADFVNAINAGADAALAL
jgi:2,4-dienoyl-CoA reductase-like NADH-dependent reductase (Old Yellow Enzyme family)/thioredoxin reductase